MDADIVILETVEEVVKKHTTNVVNPNYREIAHRISVELDQLELLHDISEIPRSGYYHVRIKVGLRVPYFVLLPKKAQQKLFTNLLKLQEA